VVHYFQKHLNVLGFFRASTTLSFSVQKKKVNVEQSIFMALPQKCSNKCKLHFHSFTHTAALANYFAHTRTLLQLTYTTT